MNDTLEELALRLSADARITTRSLWRILKVVDDEIYKAGRDGTPVPVAIRALRETIARSYLSRLEAERGGAGLDAVSEITATTAPDEGNQHQ